MFMMIGNVLSVISVAFLILSCCVGDRRRVYQMQFAETAMCAASTAFFGAWSGLTTNAIALYRNYKNMNDAFSHTDMIVTSVLTVAAGLIVNVNGLIGLIPIIATLEITYTNFYLKDVLRIKAGLLLNVALWMIYFFLIGSVPAGLGQLLTLLMGLRSYFSYGSGKRTAAA